MREMKKLKKQYQDIKNLKSNLIQKLRNLNSEFEVLMNLEISSEEEEGGEREENQEKERQFRFKKKPTREDNEISPFDLRHIFDKGKKLDSRVDIVNHLIIGDNSQVEERKGKKFWENFNGWPYTLRSKKQSINILNNHIIICGKVGKLFWFIAALRQKYLEKTGMYKQIVILDPDYLKYTGDSEHDYTVEKREKKLSQFPDVFYFSGRFFSPPFFFLFFFTKFSFSFFFV